MRLLLVPLDVGGSVGSVRGVSGRSLTSIETKMVQSGRPIRLVVPDSITTDFLLVSLGVKRAGSDQVDVCQWWGDGLNLPVVFCAKDFSAAVDFDMDLPEMSAGDSIVATLYNLNQSTRSFFGAWLIQPKETPSPLLPAQEGQ